MFTVTGKVIIGYLLIILFSVLAIGFALSRLHDQTLQMEGLVNVEFRSFELVRDLQENLVAQENIEKQQLILRDPALAELRRNRNEELARIAVQMRQLSGSPEIQALGQQLEKYHQTALQLSDTMQLEQWGEAKNLSDSKMVPLRIHLLSRLSSFRQQQQQEINSSLEDLSDQTAEAYRLTALIALVGILLSAPSTITIVVSIHRSVKALKKATRNISAGEFEHRPNLRGRDEFAQLAGEFEHMGKKLRELEQLRLDANPLTKLPGNLALDREIDMRISTGEPFSHLYIDLYNFKVYSDRYGYEAGSEVLLRVGELISRVVDRYGAADDMVGHIGGDDYVVLCSLETGEILADKIIEAFDQLVPSFYSDEDRRNRQFRGKDRYGIERTFTLMTISIAVIHTNRYSHPTRLAISQDCVRLKTQLKAMDGSNFLLGEK